MHGRYCRTCLLYTSFEGKQITILVTAQHVVTDCLDVDFQRLHVGGGNELMLQSDEYYDDGTAHGLSLIHISSKAAAKMKNFEKKPANGGMPARENKAKVIRKASFGLVLYSPGYHQYAHAAVQQGR